MKSNFFTNEIVMEFPQENIGFASNLIFLEALNGPFNYLFVNIAFDFIVLECYFCHVRWLEMGQSH